MAAKVDPLQSLFDFGLNLLAKIVPGLFGKTKTNKILDRSSQQIDYLNQKAAQQKKTVKILVIVFVILAIFVVYYFILRKRTK